jgi:tetratricopeptide (TPR) repeat protein
VHVQASVDQDPLATQLPSAHGWERAMPEGSWIRMWLPAFLIALVLSLFPGNASAQEVNVPQTRNPHLRKIARLYEAFEYEAALQEISKAENYPNNRDQEVLWIELMRGILYYSLHDSHNSDAAFRRALKKSPFTSLPLLTPSQTLYEHFNEMRKEATQAANAKDPASKQQFATPPATPAPEELNGISEKALQEKLNALEQRGRELAGGSMPPTIASSLETLRQQARQARSAHERNTVATTVDLWMNLLNDQQRAVQTHLASTSASESIPSQEETAIDLEKERLLHPISREVLNQRITELKDWVIKNVQSPRSRLEFDDQLDKSHDLMQASLNAHERMLVSIRLDTLEEQLARRFGRKIQNPLLVGPQPSAR